MMFLMERILAIPESAIADLVDVSSRARTRLSLLEPRDALHDALDGAIARISNEARILEPA